MKLNVAPAAIRTHEGGKAKHINSEQQLRRSVMACMLWEDEFYEDGQAIASRISAAVAQVAPEKVKEIAIEAREKMKLRHVPLLIVREMARLASHRGIVAETLAAVIQRPDELCEFLAIYWKEKRQTVSAQVKRGLALAFQKFNAYSLAKYNRDGAIKLRDVLFICHAKPKDDEQAATWKQLVEGTLATPDTWEVALSSGADKKETWTRLLAEKKLGALALLRNLRNMDSAGVDKQSIRAALSSMDAERVLPFRFIAAARFAPYLEPELESAMFKCVQDKEKLSGETVLLVDVSRSMDAPISSKSDLQRVDAACGLAILLREVCSSVRVITFSNQCVEVPNRRGFALRDAVIMSQPHGETALGAAIQAVNRDVAYDRLIVITDEQSRDSVPDPKKEGWIINVASARNGVGYGSWRHVDGWSEAIVDYIKTSE